MQDNEELYAGNAHREADERLKQDECILECARRLIIAIEESGRNVSFEQEGRVIMPVSLSILTFDHYKPERLVVKSYHQDWEVYGNYK